MVLAGDHQQLPPTVKSEKAAKEGLRETLFEKCIQRQPAASPDADRAVPDARADHAVQLRRSFTTAS
ncbi:MAG: hypothetical protein WKG07_49095 [Hymenobacter sp.]